MACLCHAKCCFSCWILQWIKETPWLRCIYILEGVGTGVGIGNKQRNMRGQSGKVGKECYLYWGLEESCVWGDTEGPGGREAAGHSGIWGTSISYKGIRKDRGPEIGLLVGCLRKTVCRTSSGLTETRGKEGSCVRLWESWQLDNPRQHCWPDLVSRARLSWTTRHSILCLSLPSG